MSRHLPLTRSPRRRRLALAALPLLVLAVALAAGAAPALAAGPSLTVSSIANSPTTSPPTSFTQGDGTAAFPGTGPDTYTLTVTNNGDTPTSGTVTVTAGLGSGLTFGSRSASNWTCSGTTSTTCTRSDPLAPGASDDPIVLTVSVSATAGANSEGGGVPTHVNLNLGASGGGAPTFNQTVVTPIVGRPNLTSVDSLNNAFRQGDAGDSYTISVVNQGAGASDSGSGNPPPAPIVATAALPSGETAVSMSGSGWTCSLAATTAGTNGAQYTEPADSCWRTDSWPAYTVLPAITLVVSVAPNAATPETMSTTVSGGGSVVATNTVTTSTPIQQSADLSEAVTHSGSFNQGDRAQSGDTYTLTTSNVVGPNSSVGGPTVGSVIVTDNPPLGQKITRLSGSGWNCSLAPVALSGSPNVIVPADSCTRSDVLPEGSSYPPITATVTVDDDAQSPGINGATVSGGGMSAASTANGEQTATDSVTVGQMPDLTPTVSMAGPFTQGDGAGQNDTYAIAIQNVGFAATNGTVTVRDSVPADLTPLAASGTGWTCAVSGQLVTCTEPDPLSAGSSFAPITVAVSVAPGAGTSVENPLDVSGGGEIEPGNDHFEQQTYITQLPDLMVSVTHQGAFTQGDTGDTYTLVAYNANLAATTAGATVTDTLPPGQTATAIGGRGWTCTLATLTCTRPDTLPPLGFYPPITVTVDVAGTAPASSTNSASVSGGGEVDTGDDTTGDQTTTTQRYPLSVSLAGAGSGSVSGNGINCPGTCSATYDGGTVVTLAAAAAPGSTFAGWSGACTGTGSCQVTVDAAKSATATFSPAPPATHTLSVQTRGAGKGTVSGSGISCPGKCTEGYPAQTVVKLTAKPAAGSAFAGWGGACTGTAKTCQVTLSSDRAVTASFKKAPPRCTFHAPSSKVKIVTRRRGGHLQYERSPLPAKVSCDQGAKAKLTATVTRQVKVPKRKGSKQTRTRTTRVTLRAVQGTVRTGRTLKLTLELPASSAQALAQGTRESLTLTLTVRNANGTTTKRVTLRQLRPVR